LQKLTHRFYFTLFIGIIEMLAMREATLYLLIESTFWIVCNFIAQQTLIISQRNALWPRLSWRFEWFAYFTKIPAFT